MTQHLLLVVSVMAGTPTTSANSGTPISTDSAPFSATTTASTTSGTSTDGPKLVNYYFVFLAILVCLLALVGFLIYRRRNRRISRLRNSEQNALARDLRSAQDQAGGRSRGGRSDDEENIRVEGLDERGEAPPPYKPRTDERARDAASRESGSHIRDELAVPLRTLSRENAGFKPPDYSEVTSSSVISRGAG
ncbi:hypothetical protein LTR66_006735 [Elasticomyces elasticus]|nr:hypothetical protein LTR28_005084 [Elasticomyces elasticus]KAK4990714.1 hypothetical protein LTR66_006735 [Elasticomyces elasticus]